MAKHDFMTPKAVANRQKSKGLQKLRWYCQVCQKQCRDENGFKAHTSGDAHQRQMLIVASNPTKFIQGYSEQFERAFLENLRRSHTTKRVSAHVVYNEYIRDKNHVHMNATRWTTLSGFVQYLGKTGKCVVDETEKGWFVQYINKDPVAMARQEELKRKHQSSLDHEERNRRFIQAQVKEARAAATEEFEEKAAAAKKPRVEKVSLSLKVESKPKAVVEPKKSIQMVFGTDDNISGANPARTFAADSHPKRSAVDAIMAEEQRKRQRLDEEEERTSRKDNWIVTGIIVKVMDKTVGDGAYYKKKGEIVRVVDTFGAEVRMLDSRDVLRVDQEDLETVIPLVGRSVRIVNGMGRGALATLLSINEASFCASVLLTSGPRK
ncbi:Aste57867_15160 [Aphanomyces stellatus]|uniref:Aste57867_15160 protein n=1 Tax=Aphanomyces stellatus TaxID=120398 RepID=A0A485L2H9_9STRA|nr:hypothetical protein As57867_015104 [Aphanomyces stellatus]VFT91969.1 Aste57867_15160 [Aphanomyces stellatus]